MKKLIVSLMLILSMYAFAAESAASATVGYVKYGITTGRSFISLPMQDGHTNASALSPNFDSVSKYDSAAQTWVTANWGMFGWIGDFPVSAGQSYWVNTPTTAEDFIVDGEVIANPSYSIVTGRNAVMLPLDKGSMSMASDYETETGVVNGVSKYDNSAQTWVTANWGMFGWIGDFAVDIAEPHWLNATGAVTWPGAKGEMGDAVVSAPKADPKLITVGVLDPMGAEYDAAGIAGVTFKGWIQERPAEVLNQDNNGCSTAIYGPHGSVNMDLVDLPTPYAIGETVEMLIKDENDGLKTYYEGSITYTLTEITGSAILLGYQDVGMPTGGNPITLNTPSSIEDSMTPEVTKLHQNYPNPFNPTTTIKFDLASSSVVKLNVYNYNGQLVKSLVNGQMEAGYQSVNFDANNLSAGVYYYTLEADNKVMTNKMVLVK